MRNASLLVIAMLLTGCPAATNPPAPSPAPPQVVETGDPAPPAEAAKAITLEVVDQAGYQKALEAHRGKFVLVDAWATWCVPCRKGFAHTVELHHKYAPQGLAVISLSMDDEAAHEDALAFLKESKAEFANLRSKGGAEPAAMAEFEIDGGLLPHLKLYDREGKLVKKFISTEEKPVEPQEVEAAVRELIMRETAQ